MERRALLILLALTLTGAAATSRAAHSERVAREQTMNDEREAVMNDACRKEVAELHAFFQAWFRGELEPTDLAFSRFADVLAADFEMVTPAGKRLVRDEILAGVRAAHGSAGADARRIWTRDERVREIRDGLYLATYEEWQATGETERGRISTALLRARKDAANGVEWLHVHETWLE